MDQHLSCIIKISALTSIIIIIIIIMAKTAPKKKPFLSPLGALQLIVDENSQYQWIISLSFFKIFLNDSGH